MIERSSLELYAPRPWPRCEDFVGYPITSELVAAAQYAVDTLRKIAEVVGEYEEDVFYMPGTKDPSTIRRYYGDSLRAIEEVSKIASLFNGNISVRRLSFPYIV